MENTNPKPFVFVLIPFSDEFTDIYEVGIKLACKEAGAFCEKVNEQEFEGSILERIYNQIAKADIIIADMSGRNPNVFYETGYAHALDKQVILLTQDADDIPFDLKHYPHIVYGGKIISLKTQLEKRVRWCIENPKKSLVDVDINLEFFVDGKPIIDKPILRMSEQKNPYISQVHFQFSLDTHNLTDRLVSISSYSLTLIAPENFDPYYIRDISFSKMPDDRHIYTLEGTHTLFPDGWYSQVITILLPAKGQSDVSSDMILRLFTELGIKDYPFTLEFHIEEG